MIISNQMSMDEYKSKTKKRTNNDYEHQEQVALFEWADIMKGKVPELELLFAIPNGGVRGWQTAIKLKAEGAKSGVPDVCLPVSRGEYSGMYIEMKYGKNKASENQNWWISRLDEQGYYVRICYGAEEAIDIITKYLEIRI